MPDRVFRTLNARERQLMKPYLDKAHAADAAKRVADAELARVLELTEPRFAQLGVSFNYDTLSFTEPPPQSDSTLTTAPMVDGTAGS